MKRVLFTMLLCCIGGTSFANILVGAATGGTNICSNNAANGSTPAYTTLGVITLTEVATPDFGNSTSAWQVNISIAPPTGWTYNSATPPVLAVVGTTTDIISVTSTFYNANILIFQVKGTGQANIDAITITGLQVQASAMTSASGSLGITAFGGTAAGLGGTAVDGGDLSQSPVPIIGNTAVCQGNITTLSDGTGAGVWSSGNTTIATVTTTGDVTGVAAGTTIIDYTVAGCVTTHSVTVHAPAGTFGGVTTVCTGLTTTLSNSVTGGTWSSGNTTIATVTSATNGTVKGVAAGTAIIAYNITSCATATVAVTVNATPAIGGPATICIGGALTLSDNLAGGTWVSGTPGIATIGSTTGTLGGVAQGNTPITYTITATGCAKTTTVAVNAPPNATITGTASVCTGLTTQLNNSVTGGAWTSSATAKATVTNVGLVTGVAPGTTIISYTIVACPSATLTVTVNQSPTVITGTAAVCQNSTIQLSDGIGGGVWSSSNNGRATVAPSGATGGLVTGVAGGAVNILYTLGSCSVTHSITVNGLPNNITGTPTLCTGTTTQLSDGTPAGTWSSVTTGVATIDGTGLVSGTTAGTSVISYTSSTTGCARTTTVTVHQSPDPITGAMNVCEGLTTNLSDDSTPAGTWSSINTTIATVDGSGVVSGIIPDTVSIIYHEPVNGCIAIALITVNGTPSSISGITTVCQGSTTTLSNTSPGGAWSSDNTAVATIDPALGIAGGVSPGTATITYAFGASCAMTATLTVNPFPQPGTITGADSICLGSTVTLNEDSTNGVWSSDNTSVATVDTSSGAVSGVTLGSANIIYTITNGFGCGPAFTSFPIVVDQLTPTVNISANPGLTSCLGSPVTFTADSTNGGAAPTYEWFTRNSISFPGNPFTYTPEDGDTVIVKMTSSAACVSTTVAYDTVIMTVAPTLVPSVSIRSDIYGDSVCTGTLTQFTATTVNGGPTPSFLWYVNGVFNGSTVNPLQYIPNPGDTVSCQLISSYTCAVPDSVLSNNVVMSVFVTEEPTVTITSNANPSCKGAPVTFTAHTIFGGLSPFIRWAQDGVNVATGPMYTIVPQNGDQFFCVLKSNSTCLALNADSVFSNVIYETVDSAIVPVVTAFATHTAITIGQHDTLIAAVSAATPFPTYQWYLNGVIIPGATSGVYVADPGAAGILYYYCIVGNGNACNTTKTTNLLTITVGAVGVNQIASGDYDLKLAPNPNTGSFTIEGTISTDNQDITLEVTNVVGQIVYKGYAPVKNELLKQQIILGNDLANGVYLLNVITNNAHKVIRFTLSR